MSNQVKNDFKMRFVQFVVTHLKYFDMTDGQHVL